MVDKYNQQNLYNERYATVFSFDEFVSIISQTTLQNKIPFNYESDFIKLYFGKDKSRQISYR
jgi:solute carrier family 25 aspartate/glutamate transporter 12/13